MEQGDGQDDSDGGGDDDDDDCTSYTSSLSWTSSSLSLDLFVCANGAVATPQSASHHHHHHHCQEDRPSPAVACGEQGDQVSCEDTGDAGNDAGVGKNEDDGAARRALCFSRGDASGNENEDEKGDEVDEGDEGGEDDGGGEQ